MKTTSRQILAGRMRRLALVFLFLPLMAEHSNGLLQAYPPAPHHLIYGMARDEYGSPLAAGATIILETSAGVQIKTSVVGGLEPGINYKLEVPMDAGLTSDLYKPTALKPTVPFQIKVIVAGVTNLPIELKGNFAVMGQPGKRTLLNLTLGEDTNGDGLPDAWERMINSDINQIKPGDLAANGMTYLQNYIAGTYAFDPSDGFALSISGLNNGRPVMKFLAVRGRSYTLFGSSDLKSWVPVNFRLTADGSTAVQRVNYQANDVRQVELEAATENSAPAPIFFKLMVQ